MRWSEDFIHVTQLKLSIQVQSTKFTASTHVNRMLK